MTQDDPVRAKGQDEQLAQQQDECRTCGIEISLEILTVFQKSG
jgi:hypothetical protein